MLNHLEILDKIDKLLADKGLENKRQELEFEFRVSSIGEALCSISDSILLTLKNTNKKIEPIVGHIINYFIAYCNHNRLFTKPNYES